MGIQHVSLERISKFRQTKPVFRQGQIIQGRILKLYPNNKAQIQLGSIKLIAQLEASLTIGESYHFQIRSTGDMYQLKVLGEKLKNNFDQNISELMRALGLKFSKRHMAFLKLLINEKIPFDKNQLMIALSILDRAKNEVAAQHVLKSMLASKLPMTDSVFQALYNVNTSSLSERITALLWQLKTNSDPDQLQQNLIEKLTSLTGRSANVLNLWTNPKDQFLHHVRQVLAFVGLNHELQLENNQHQTTIKSMLMELIKQSDGIIKEHSQQLLHYMDGMKINSVQESADFIQASLQLPGKRLGLSYDMQLDFEGKKTETGVINSDYCRIAFYLDLINLKETVIEMNIQKRSVAITIFNDHQRLNDLAAHFKPMLKEGLQAIDYYLSSVHVKSFKEQKINRNNVKFQTVSIRQGVDYRI